MKSIIGRRLTFKTHSFSWGKVAALAVGALLTVNAAWGQGQGWYQGNNYATPYAFMTIVGSPGVLGGQDGTNEVAQFGGPIGIAVGTNNSIYVVDDVENDVRQLKQVGSDWVVTTIAGTAGVSGSQDGSNAGIQFGVPTSIASDRAGNLYVTDAQFNTIRKLTPSGQDWISTTIAGTPGPDGTRDGTNGVAQFDYPCGIATDTAGNVFVADTYNHTIRKLSPSGTTNWVVTTIAGLADVSGSDDGTNQDARFNRPIGLAVDGSGNIFVADSENNLIRKITPVGANWVTTTIAGHGGDSMDGTNTVAGFYFASGYAGLAVDTNDNIYVADSGNGLVREISPVGTDWVTTTLGGSTGAFADGAVNGAGTNAAFAVVAAVAVVAQGRLFAADAGINDVLLGVPYVPALPALSISRAAGPAATIWWLGAPYTLQTNSSLATTNWVNYGGTITSLDGTNSVTVPAGTGPLFFRLSQ